MLFPGPRYNIESLFKSRLTGFSQHYCGSLVSYGNVSCRKKIGDFTLISNNEKSPRGFRATFNMFKTAYGELSNAKKQGRQFDLIVSYDPLKVGLMALLLSKLFSVPFAVEVNGDYSSPYNYIDIKNKFKRVYTRSKLMMVQRFVLKRAKGIKKLYTKQLSSERYLERKIVAQYANYTDLSIFDVLSTQSTNKVIFVGFPYFLKGVDLLIQAFSELANDFPDWRLEIVGWFQDKAPLDEAMSKCPFIDYRPPVYFDEMPKVISSADILVLPSRTEAMGRVLLEAAKSGVARIGSNAGGIPEVITHGEDGLVFNNSDSAELNHCLRRLMGDKAYRLELIENATKSLKQKHSEGRYIENTVNFYESVITG